MILYGVRWKENEKDRGFMRSECRTPEEAIDKAKEFDAEGKIDVNIKIVDTDSSTEFVGDLNFKEEALIKPLYAVVHVTTKTIKSKWFVIREHGLVEVTDRLMADVKVYNEHASLKIPFSYKDGYIVYPFGCGLTHYLQSDILNEVTSLDVNAMRCVMTDDFKMYGFKKTEKDFMKVLHQKIMTQGVY